MAPASPLHKRLVFVTGKGGVGKTTVAAAIGLAGADSGRRTIIAEVAEQERITGLFGQPAAGYRETEVADGLSAFSLNPEEAKEEWLRDQLRSGRLAGMLGSSRIFTYLTAAAPGLDELVTLGKIWELAQMERRNKRDRPFETCVVDAPATGHGLAMLRSPRTYAEIAKVGPVAKHAGHFDRFIRDGRSTAVVAVALAEEMPVNETIDLQQRLRDEVGVELAAVIVNAVLPERYSNDEAEKLQSLDGQGGPATREAVATALIAHSRAREQRSQIGRLRRAVDVPVITLPFLLTPEVDLDGLRTLAAELERKL
ncbi:MAG TPA: ArsA family ATPase [Thermoleophilaceae bacterium]|nr:ArsA family ATPase [Thermoleophilaceae bacterium]